MFATLAAAWLWRPLTAGQRRAGRPVSRGARPDTRSLPPQCGRGRATRSGRRQTHSHALVDRLGPGRPSRNAGGRIPRTSSARACVGMPPTLAAVAAATALLVCFGPAFLRNGLRRCSSSTGASRRDAVPDRGHARHGHRAARIGSADQGEADRLQGRLTPRCGCAAASDGAWERVPLVPTSDPLVFEGILFHLEKPIDYKVCRTASNRRCSR